MRNVALQRATVNDGSGAARNRPRSSDRVLQLLTAVGTASDGLSLTEAAANAGLVPSTALRQLRSLEAAGLVVRDADQTYRAGPALVELSRTVFVGRSFVSAAQPFLDQLAVATGESAYLAIAKGTRRAAYIATAPGEHSLRHSGWLGREFNSGGTAVGAALGGRADVDGAVTRTDRLELGITAVSATVRSARGIVGALSVVGPTFRLTGHALRVAQESVACQARELSVALGDR